MLEIYWKFLHISEHLKAFRINLNCSRLIKPNPLASTVCKKKALYVCKNDAWLSIDFSHSWQKYPSLILLNFLSNLVNVMANCKKMQKNVHWVPSWFKIRHFFLWLCMYEKLCRFTSSFSTFSSNFEGQ